jgi:hypothetical protein
MVLNKVDLYFVIFCFIKNQKPKTKNQRSKMKIYTKLAIIIAAIQQKLNCYSHKVYSNKIKLTVTTMNPMTRVNIDEIRELPNEYPEEFTDFCKENNLTPPKITTGNGRALSVMLENQNKYWDRESCDAFVAKFDIKTKDSIQLFNKHSQWGIETSSGKERGKLFILYPYQLSNKHKMRKDFKYDGTESEKNTEIDRIKSTIKSDYIDPPYEKWQLGHKNPGSTDSSNENLILQPPIQGKYRDDYLFFDTLTKMPLPKKLKKMLENKEIELTNQQICEYIKVLSEHQSPYPI